METLIQQPESLRDGNWELQFLDAILAAKVQVEGDRPQGGPDGMPYMLVKTSIEAEEPFLNVVRWLKTRGIGLAVNTHKMVPDYVFTYGMVWNYCETGRFVQPVSAQPAGEVVIRADDKPVIGEPTEKYLPAYVRGNLRDFLKHEGFPAPKILVATSADFKNTDLVFSVESLNGISEKDRAALAARLTWFLPMHYSMVFGSEKDWPDFFNL